MTRETETIMSDMDTERQSGDTSTFDNVTIDDVLSWEAT